MFRQATKQQSKLRMTLDGPAGSGKSYTALRFAHELAGSGGRIAAIDTERGSLSKYVGESPDGIPWAFDVAELADFSPQKYTDTIKMAGRAGYAVLVIDSLSHAWEGAGGALEMKQRAGDSWAAWRHVTPFHNAMIDAILQSPMHVITTMRSRMEYVQEQDDKGKTVIRRVGMSPIQRPGMEYEFDVLCDIDWNHILTVGKTRCAAIDGKMAEKPGPEFMRPIIEWLYSGLAPQAPVQGYSVANAPIPVALTLDQLCDTYGAEKIFSVNGGRLPETQDEIDTLALRLAKEEN